MDDTHTITSQMSVSRRRPGGGPLGQGLPGVPPNTTDWSGTTREPRTAFVDHPELDPALNGSL
jgi:hypothetical protein